VRHALRGAHRPPIKASTGQTGPGRAQR